MHRLYKTQNKSSVRAQVFSVTPHGIRGGANQTEPRPQIAWLATKAEAAEERLDLAV